MSNNRKYAQSIHAAFHAYILNTYPADKSLTADAAAKIAKSKADSAARKVYDEIVLRGKPMGVWVQYEHHGHDTTIYVFYHPNSAAHQVW